MADAQALSRALEAMPRRWSAVDVASIAQEVYDSTCRTDFDAPGFCVVEVPGIADPVSLRQGMLALKEAMDAVHASRSDGRLVCLSASRFDQRRTTRLHLDGGPDESILMLGYEPTAVRARIDIADYARCAHDLGMTPKAFMAEHNPMFHPADGLLDPYTTQVPGLSPGAYRILCINNASAPYSPDRMTWQGVLHAATIDAAAVTGTRIVNSLLIGAAPLGATDAIGKAEEMAFVSAPSQQAAIGQFGDAQ
jgi:hypothetical protein